MITCSMVSYSNIHLYTMYTLYIIMNKKELARYEACKHYKQHKQPCLLCGSTNTIKHHEDYNKSLNVIWLCPVCHGQYHKNKLDVICINTIKNCYKWFYVKHYVTYDWYIKNKATFPKNPNFIYTNMYE